MRSRIIGWTVLGLLVGLLLGLLLLTPVVLYFDEPMGWSDRGPEVPYTAAAVLWLAWTGYLGGRFGYKVGTYEDPAAGGPTRRRTWAGAGWTLTVAPGLVEVGTAQGTQQFTGDQLARVFLVRTGPTWSLELPDDSIRVLDGLEQAEAEEIQRSLSG